MHVHLCCICVSIIEIYTWINWFGNILEDTLVKNSNGNLCPFRLHLSWERHKGKSKNTAKLKTRGLEFEGTAILVDIEEGDEQATVITFSFILSIIQRH